jgi:predicted metal-dependent phosphoesterase TrpH
VIAQAKAAGLDVVALTDHDSADGWEEAAQAATSIGVALVRGTELSTRTHGITVHLLSYLHNPTHPAIEQMNRRIREARRERAQAMVQRLARDYPITWEQVAQNVGENVTVGRPHIADQLVELGVIPDRSAAFQRLLHPASPYYVRYWTQDTTEAVQIVREAGGVPVFAHPGASARQRLVSDAVIAQLVEAGLAGLEIHHRENPPEQRERLTRLAEQLGLLQTGSSDYHGAGKPNRLGENLTSPEVLAAILEQGQLELVGAATWAR